MKSLIRLIERLIQIFRLIDELNPASLNNNSYLRNSMKLRFIKNVDNFIFTHYNLI